MKKHFSGFIAGIISTLIVMVLIIPAMAESLQQIRFNMVNIELNETQITAKDQDYTLDSGVSVPNSLSYVDENGGSTTYLPLRKLAELLSLNVDWVGETGTVVLNSIDKNEMEGGENEMNNREGDEGEVIGYDEFKAMWDRGVSYKHEDHDSYTMKYNDSMTEKELETFLRSIDRLTLRTYMKNIAIEILQENPLDSAEKTLTVSFTIFVDRLQADLSKAYITINNEDNITHFWV